MSVSGLNHEQAQRARNLAVHAAKVGLRHKDSVHYTQGSQRWEGISHGLKAFRGQYPHNADCSAYVTWCIWNGLSHFKVGDTVNGARWQYGYTGTMVNHGILVQQGLHHPLMTRRKADAVIYGDPFGGTGHTALVVGHETINGRKKLMVISFGSEAGPFYLPYDYRSDVHSIRRYI